MTAWRREALHRIKPTPDEDAKVQSTANALVQDVQHALDQEGWEGTPRLEGSLAKGTYLHGDADLDVFVAFPTTVDRGTLEQRVHTLKHLLDAPEVAYAEHPYAQGTYEGHDAEIVPCYDLEDPREPRSAVDRTPFHTEHVKATLTEEARDEVRLLKAFLQTAGCYGAKEAVRGISGYLAELLILQHGTFEDVLAWATRGCPHPLTFDGPPDDSFQENPLVVTDPVDPGRNAAAAVRPATLERFREAAAAFRKAPDVSHFEPPPASRLKPRPALDRCTARSTRVLAVRVPLGDELEDPVHAQLRRAVTLARAQLERDQVPVHATATLLEEEPRAGWILLEAHEPALAEPYVHRGPPAGLEEHAGAFRDQWANAAEAASDVYTEEGRLFVKVHREVDTLAGIVRPHLEGANAGKIVDQALDDGSADVFEGEHAIAEAPARARAALLDRRRPWERAVSA